MSLQDADLLDALRGHLADYLPQSSWTLLVEPGDLREQGKFYLERVADLTGLFSIPSVFQQLTRFPSIHVTALPSSSVEATCHLRVESVERFSGDVTKVKDELDSAAATDLVFIACHNEAEKKRLGEVLASGRLAQEGRLRLVVGHVTSGFRLVGAAAHATPRTPVASAEDAGGIVVLGDHELFHREQAPALLPRRQLESRAIDSFLDLREDDLVVHLRPPTRRRHAPARHRLHPGPPA